MGVNKREVVSFIEPYISETELRPSVINWSNLVKAVVDGYRAQRGIAHGVQKDAIQNGWDARRHKKGTGWDFTFELIENKDCDFLTMTDRGTTGLTGRILKPEELMEDLPPNEKWGRFENMAFTKEPSEEALGSRGRGKFIFVGASSQYVILYDSLREDGSYRFGVLTVRRTDCRVAAFDEDDGRKKLFEITKGALKPLAEVGTRVIIVDPCEELIDAIKSGEFLRYIGETWWEILLKYGVRIVLRMNGHDYVAKPPDEFVLPEEDTKRYRVWIRNPSKITVLGTKFKITKLHIISDRKGGVPEDIRGISIQRGGMKICPVEFRYMEREIAETIYGYVTLDSDTERLLLEDESIEHYSYDFRGPIPRAIKHYIEDEIHKFAREKLGWGIDARELRRRQQRSAERRALIAANKFARMMGIGPGEPPQKEIYIQMKDPALPRAGDLRVNYGESVSDIKACVVNDSNSPARLTLKLFLQYANKPVKYYVNQDISIQPSRCSAYFGPFKETFTKQLFPDIGKYTLTAEVFSAQKENRKAKLDRKAKRFYLEEEPPEREVKKVYIQMDDLTLPRAGDLRVNYGESVGNIKARVVNNDDSEIKIRFKIFLRFYDKLIKNYNEQDITIPPHACSEYFGPYQEIFAEEEFPDKGRYTVATKIVSLREVDKGTELDAQNKSFYLEEDPPARGLFETCEPLEFPERAIMLMAESTSGERGGLILQYNVNHPAQRAVENSEDDLASYLVRLMGHELCRFDLLQDTPVLFEESERGDGDAILRKTLKVAGELLYKFHRGVFD